MRFVSDLITLEEMTLEYTALSTRTRLKVKQFTSWVIPAQTKLTLNRQLRHSKFN